MKELGGGGIRSSGVGIMLTLVNWKETERWIASKAQGRGVGEKAT